MVKIKFEDGVHHIRNDVYHMAEGYSRSVLMHLNKSPAHFFYEQFSENKEEKTETDAMILGNLFHTLLLEPNLYQEQYIFKPSFPKLPEVGLLKDVGREEYDKQKKARENESKRREEVLNEFESQCQGKIVITQETYELASSMAKATMDDKLCQDLIIDAQYEQSIFWTDKETGLQFKARPDIWHAHMVVDLKSTIGASYDYFQRTAMSNGYILQAGMMREACDAIGKPFERFIFLAVEKSRPFARGIYPIDDMAIEFGVEQFNVLKRRLATCLEKNEWPSYPIRDLSLPRWASINDYED